MTTRSLISVPLLAAAAALLLTSAQLVAVDRLAQQRQVGAVSQVVELPRVVISGKRIAAATPALQLAAAADGAPSAGAY